MEKITWKVPEYPEYTRDMRWYLTAAGIGLIFLIYAIYTGNFMFAVIIIMGVLISIISSYKKPANINFTLSDEGVRLGEAFWPWQKFQSYWIVGEGKEKNLGLDLKNWLFTDLYIPITDVTAEEAEKFVSKFLKKNPERKHEPISYSIGRRLKI
jgi:hypothetical protein